MEKWKYDAFDDREVSTIMRYLGAYPSEKDIIKKILPEVQYMTPYDYGWLYVF